jgi:hypothetical protein
MNDTDAKWAIQTVDLLGTAAAEATRGKVKGKVAMAAFREFLIGLVLIGVQRGMQSRDEGIKAAIDGHVGDVEQ